MSPAENYENMDANAVQVTENSTAILRTSFTIYNNGHFKSKIDVFFKRKDRGKCSF